MPRPKEKLHKSKSAVNAIKDKLTQFKSHYLGSSLEHGLFPDCKQAGAVYDVPRKMSLRRTSSAMSYTPGSFKSKNSRKFALIAAPKQITCASQSRSCTTYPSPLSNDSGNGSDNSCFIYTNDSPGSNNHQNNPAVERNNSSLTDVTVSSPQILYISESNVKKFMTETQLLTITDDELDDEEDPIEEDNNDQDSSATITCTSKKENSAIDSTTFDQCSMVASDQDLHREMQTTLKDLELDYKKVVKKISPRTLSEPPISETWIYRKTFY